MKKTFFVSALVFGTRTSERIEAYSEKQAEFLFCQRHGYRSLRDFYSYVSEQNRVESEQLTLF